MASAAKGGGGGRMMPPWNGDCLRRGDMLYFEAANEPENRDSQEIGVWKEA